MWPVLWGLSGTPQPLQFSELSPHTDARGELKTKVGSSRGQKGKLRQGSSSKVAPGFPSQAHLPLGHASLLQPEPPHPQHTGLPDTVSPKLEVGGTPSHG